MRPIVFRILSILLRPLSWLYGIVVRCRNLLYDRQLLKSYTFSRQVISVGNLTVGGTGKTPLVKWLAEELRREGLRPGIVSRGYGRSSKDMLVVHDGVKLQVNVSAAGDEPFLLARQLKNIPIVVDSNRVRGIRKLLEQFPVDVVILDDGFQHRRAARDLDLLLFNSRETGKHYVLIPSGRLREPLSGASRASLLVYTKSTDHKLPDVHSRLTQFTTAPAVTAGLQPELIRYSAGDLQTVQDLPVNPFAFCGIGDPGSFTAMTEQLGIQPGGVLFFRDHQVYSAQVLHKLEKEIRTAGCGAILTTEKDLVKLPDDFLESFEVFAIRIELSWTPRERKIISALLKRTIV
ncbi:MAG: tetraacyldisaccharide 4'-kinase [FCB group bacterium]|nr:tetraacyldisaccharide 4'-kinase [FCB group bacterium]